MQEKANTAGKKSQAKCHSKRYINHQPSVSKDTSQNDMQTPKHDICIRQRFYSIKKSFVIEIFAMTKNQLYLYQRPRQ